MPARTDTLLDELGIRYEAEADLAEQTWYGVGGRARMLAHPSNIDQLVALTSRCFEHGVALRVLGAGANLLVADGGVDGVVVRLDEPFWRRVQAGGTAVTVGAGHDLMRLVLWTARRGLAGLDVLAGIPATVGGAVRMNAGGAFGEIGPTVQSISVMDHAGDIHMRPHDDLHLGYRTSSIAAPLILEARLELRPDDPQKVKQNVKEVFQHKKASQPLAEHSAGCAFKNPPPEADDKRPRPAGALIDGAGLKGIRIGGAEISAIHANFVITHRGCTAGDVLRLIEHVQENVAGRFGVHLEREVVLWP
jgi:UDP-N-acetylmuramate dehydrogenase